MLDMYMRVSPEYDVQMRFPDPVIKAGAPSGEIEITSNGDYNVEAYASAHVAVPEPTGTINITVNGDYNVANYASAHVDVPTRPGNTDVFTFSPDEDTNNLTVPYDKARIIDCVLVSAHLTAPYPNLTMTAAYFKFINDNYENYVRNLSVTGSTGNESGSGTQGTITVDTDAGTITMSSYASNRYYRSNINYVICIIYKT